MRHVSEWLVPGFGRPVLLCRGRMPRARGMAVYVRDGYRTGGRFSKHAKVTLTNSCYLNLGYGQILPSRAIFKTFQQSTVAAFDRIIDHKLRQPLDPIKCYGESAGC